MQRRFIFESDTGKYIIHFHLEEINWGGVEGSDGPISQRQGSWRQLDTRGWVITLYWFCQVISTSVSHTGGSGRIAITVEGSVGLEEEDGGSASHLIPAHSPAPRWPCEHARCA